MTLTEFLTARLDEDEAVAREVQARRRADAHRYEAGSEPDPDESWMYSGEDSMDSPAVVIGPARVLAEVEAKRRIVAEHHPVDPCDAHDASMRTIECDTLRLLALPYADHPDYDEAWRV